ncbi:VCBS domain-containing protein [Vibrio tubiashii]|uniref:VCBS domain-containing protein n=1 Tax=Vibrio tubiashii TaxID=29498 RepID=UPI003CE48D67
MVGQFKLITETYVVIGLDGRIKIVDSMDEILSGEVIIDTLENEIQPEQIYVLNELGHPQPEPDAAKQVAQLLEALENGVDPSELGDEFATAAGGAGGSSLTESGTIERIGAEVLASTYFETAGFSSEQSTTLFNLLRNSQTDIAQIRAIIAGDDSGSVQEDTVLETSGQLSISDSNTGEAFFQPQTNVQDGNWGSFSVDVNGNWSYQLNNDHPDVQALNTDSEPVTRILTVTSVDGTTHQVEITITGTNDAAQISGDDKGAVTEGDGNVILEDKGTLTSVDVDGNNANDTFKTDVTPTTHPSDGAPLGSLTISEGGEWTYKVDNSKVEYLGEGQTRVETFTVYSQDGTPHQVEITITGTNDAAQISGDDKGAVTEGDGNVILEDKGTLTSVDVDGNNANDTFKADVTPNNHPSGGAPLGSLTITEGGEWTYNVDNSKVEYLGEGQTRVETFTVYSQDGTPHQVEITITGTNDAAQISGDDKGAVTEGDGNVILEDKGTLTSVDVDGNNANDTFKTEVTPNNHPSEGAPLGSLTITEGGEWTYNVDNSKVEYLGEGQTRIETFTVYSQDGTPHQVEITITGTNDAAQISGDDKGAVTEGDGNVILEDKGTLTSVDVDGNNANDIFKTEVTPNNHPSEGAPLGSLTITEGGEWTYNVDNSKVEYLGEGQTRVETFTVYSQDGTPHQVEITITGTNDTAEISGDDKGAVTEGDGNVILEDKGTLTSVDMDGNNANDTFKTEVTPNNHPSEGAPLGGLTITEGGEWTYNVDNSKVEYLGEGQTRVETFTVYSQDGTPHQVEITITGTNDAAQISGDDKGAVTEGDGNVILEDKGTLTSVDVDGNNANDTFKTEVTPNNHSSEGAPLGSLTITEGGEWTYNVDNSKVEYLGEGQTRIETFTVYSQDGTPHQVEITITGTNDAAQISGDDKGAVTEGDGNVILEDKGTLTSVDVDGNNANDTNDTFKTDVTPDNHPSDGAPLGSLTITEGGEWTYNVDNSKVEYLGEGQTRIETFTVYSQDGTPHQVEITITGTNDEPEFISGSNDSHGRDSQGNIDADSYQFSVDENTPTGVIGKVEAFDIDQNSQVTYHLTNHTDLFEINTATGEISVKNGVTFDHETIDSYQLVVEARDQFNGKDTAQVKVLINDLNEAPIAEDDKGIEKTTKTLDQNNWDNSADISVDYYVIDTTTGNKVADASKSDYTGDGDHKYGVSSSLDKGSDRVQDGQIGYDDVTGQSEAMRFSFANGQVSNHAEVEVKNLWTDTKNGSWEPGIERGVWKAYYKGELVATGVFEGTRGGSQVVSIDADGRYFDSIEMSTISYKDGVVDPKGSEYFVTQVSADLTTFDDSYQTSGSGTLELDVLANDHDPDGDDLTIVDYPKEDFLTLKDGKLVFDAAKYLESLPANERIIKTGEVKEYTFEYTIKDEDGLKDTAEVTVSVMGEPMSLNDAHAELNESELGTETGAHAEGDLVADLGSATDAEYRFEVDQNLSGFTSGGKPVSFEVSADQTTLTGYTGAGSDRVKVLEATIDVNTGHYSVVQHSALDHAEQGADKIDISAKVEVNAGGQSESAILHLDVTDSVPSSNSAHHVINDVALQSNTVVIALDASQSMSNQVLDADGHWVTRWELARDSITAMFEKYQDVGDVQFKIAAHSGFPDGQISGWLSSVGDIRQFFFDVQPSAWTPYSQAIDQVHEVLTDPTSQSLLNSTNTQLYFISDGVTTDFGGWTNQSGGYETKARESLMKWSSEDDFSSPERYQQVRDGLVKPTTAEEKMILENAMEKSIETSGQTIDNIWSVGIGAGADLKYLEPIATDKGSAIVVVDDAQIEELLIKTVSGQLQSDLITHHGGEEQWVDTIVVEGDTYHFDKLTGEVTKSVAGHIETVSESPLVKIDTTHGHLTVNFENGRYDYKANNVDGHQQDKFIARVVDADGDVAESQIIIDVQDTSQPDSSRNIVQGDSQANTLNGTDGNDALVGYDGADTLNGGAGDDILIGGLDNDVLLGGLGSDILTGGAGNDVFAFSSESLNISPDQDIIKDFHLNEDKLDFTDVLAPLGDEGKDMENLLNHLTASFDADKETLNIDLTADDGKSVSIALEQFDMSGLDLSVSASSHEIVEQLFQHQAFKVD